jgi:uncharacterized Zn finger protein
MFQVSLGYLLVSINSAIIMTMRQVTESDVRSLATDQSFQRGEGYYASGAVREIEQQGETITARVRGHQADSYSVTIRLGPTGVSSTRCSCPYDWGGICKHTVATLLTLVRHPDSVERRPPLEELLAQRSKQDLVILVKEMIARQPELARLLDLPFHPDSSVPLDLAKFEKQVHYALSREEAEWAGRELERLSEMALRYQEAGDSTTAGRLYHLILEKTLVHFEGWWTEWDSEGDISRVASDCIEGLAVCLENVEDPETRRPWLEVLLEAYFEDIRQGGIDYFWSADGYLLEQATDEEWRWIERQVREEMDRREHWGRATLVGFLTSRLEMAGQEDEADAFILAHGTAEQRAYLLLDLGRAEEAVEIARQHFAGLPGRTLDFADRLEKAGHGDVAVAYVAEQEDARSSTHYRPWLARHFEGRGDPSAALDLWHRQFEESPRLETYHELQRLGKELNIWEHLRSTVLESLDPQRQATLLINIALDEENVARALEIVSQPKAWLGAETLLRVAQTAEADHPRAALEVYRSQAEQAIRGKNRASYALAAEYLGRVRELYRRLGEENIWQAYITRLREEYRRLWALKEELDKVGL